MIVVVVLGGIVGVSAAISLPRRRLLGVSGFLGYVSATSLTLVISSST